MKIGNTVRYPFTQHAGDAHESGESPEGNPSLVGHTQVISMQFLLILIKILILVIPAIFCGHIQLSELGWESVL